MTEKDSKLFDLIRRGTLGTSLIIWALIGLVFWIPRLITSIFSLWIGSIAAAVTNSDLIPLRKRLHSATEFYSNGFRQITIALGREVHSQASNAEKVFLSWDRLLFQFIEAGIFWIVVYLVIKLVFR